MIRTCAMCLGFGVNYNGPCLPCEKLGLVYIPPNIILGDQ
jgi:hypothetical protein